MNAAADETTIVTDDRVASVLPSRQRAPDDGYIDLLEARVSAGDLVHRLQARADIQLSPAVQAALASGVTLEFVLEIELAEPRPLWIDRTLVRMERRATLVYYELTRHYRVQVLPATRWPQDAMSVDTPAITRSRNFRSLLGALDAVGDFRGIALADADVVLPADIEALLRFRLDTGALPIPLQPVFDSDWRLDSGRYRWYPWSTRG